ncbi:MAG: endonuclease III domain-containing protein [Terriglobales bacterium]
MEHPWQAYEQRLRRHFAGLDLERWWPAHSRFEMIAGALLVQNTRWTNVVLALAALKGSGKLSLAGVRGLSEAELGRLIRSSGAWRQKARRLKGFVAWLDATHGGSLHRLFSQPTAEARRQLLALEGFGPETTDAVLVFAGRHARFIVDAYTRRIFGRHRLALAAATAAALPARQCRDLHALLVETAKRYCRKHHPDCGHCPLQPLLP